MKLHVMSDLHMDLMSAHTKALFWDELERRVDGVDGVVLAGDIGSIRKKYNNQLLQVLQRFEELYPRVFYIPGNHEFWYEGLRHSWQILNRWQNQLPLTHILHSSKPHVQYQGETIGGDTLWYPDCDDVLLQQGWCDYQAIADSWTQINKQHQGFLAQKELPEIVVTHHFPTAESVAPRWRGDPYNVFFCADIGDWLVRQPVLPRLWIHGHTHNPMDYMSKLGFRVYCNPLGYYREGENPAFWERLLVDTDPSTWQYPSP